MGVYIKDSGEEPCACIIWMHGLGSDANDMAGLARELRLSSSVRHIFLDAPIRPVTLNNNIPMRAWYDIYELHLNAREDLKGAQESAARVDTIIQQQIEEGFTDKQIFLAGFSQGGAMALYTALTHRKTLGGVIALSSYLPGIRELKNITLAKNTPIFFATGKFDPVVLPLWSEISLEWLQANGFKQLTTHVYPMEHSICIEEILDASKWLQKQIELNNAGINQ